MVNQTDAMGSFTAMVLDLDRQRDNLKRTLSGRRGAKFRDDPRQWLLFGSSDGEETQSD